MKKAIKYISLVICASFFYSGVLAQQEDKILKFFDSTRSKDLTSLKTNTLAELLQASINNGIISTKGTDINIKATLFQLKKIWRPEIILDTNYVKETFNRNFEFGLGFKINTDNKINGVGASIKYAIINKRDVTRQDLPELSVKAKALDVKIAQIVDDLHDAIGQKLQTGMRNSKFINNDKDGSLTKKVTASLSKFDTASNDPKALEQLGTDLGNDILNDMDLDLSIFEIFNYPEAIKAVQSEAKNFEDYIKKRALLTFSFASNYINNSWDSLTLKLEYLQGLGNKSDQDKPWDIYAAVFCDSKMDTVLKKPLGKQVFIAKFGLNKVLIKNRDQKNSFLEILGAAEYNYNLKGRYKEEKKSMLIADFTLSIRISPTLFLPLEIKYDIKNENVFGFLKVKWDLPRTSGKN